ncbi:MAG: hypothetical protein K2Y16_04970 [Burkholderiales bacterium]|nr:hypothetical protein [Burkholderiales bacterium]
MNVKQKVARAKRIRERTLEIRQQLWPNVNDAQIWNRLRDVGFITIPRTLPLILQIVDTLSKGLPLSSTYFALWCRSFDEGVIEITNPRLCAFEAGFSGERQESTWARRMRILRDFGFILVSGGPYGEFSYVLLLNPYSVIKQLNAKSKIPQQLYVALLSRADEIGSNSLVRNVIA